jgi:hypothetical protein
MGGEQASRTHSIDYRIDPQVQALLVGKIIVGGWRFDRRRPEMNLK